MPERSESHPGPKPAGDESGERLQLILANSRAQAIFMLDPDGKITDWPAGAAAVFGYAADEIVGHDGDILFLAEDRHDGAPEQERTLARDEGSAPDNRWHLHKNGGHVLIEGVTTALRDRAGALTGYLKIGQDVTGRHDFERRERKLAAELYHRVRNSMAVMRSIVRRTAENSESVEEMAAHLQGRIEAFARVQSIMARDVDAGVDLASIVADELVAHAAKEGEQLSLEGPDVLLAPKTAETLSLAIHELATNAIKFGALGARDGRLKVRWKKLAGKRLRFVWEESGRDRPLVAAERIGFGFELLQRTLPYDLDAETEIEFLADGLRFTLNMPLAGMAPA